MSTNQTLTPAQAQQTPPARSSPGELIERALGKGDLSGLTAEQRMDYLRSVCESLGLNPLTRPFDFLTDKKGKTVLYARKDCTDQLRRLHHVTLEIAAREIVDEMCIVHVKAHVPAAKGGHKRDDEDVGVVPLTGLRGEDRANAIMKAITKAKRRVTLSICGLGLLDETEVESVESRPQVVVTQTQPANGQTPAALPAPAPAALPQGTVTVTQLESLRQLKSVLGLDTTTWQSRLAPHGVLSARDLTAASADTLLRDLRGAVSARSAQEAQIGGDGLPNLPPPGQGAAKQATFP